LTCAMKQRGTGRSPRFWRGWGIALGLSLGCAGPLPALVLATGSEEVFGPGNPVNEDVFVFAGGGNPTEVVLLPGAFIDGDLSLFGNCELRMEGGTVTGGVNASDDVKVWLRGGAVGGFIAGFGSSRVIVTGTGTGSGVAARASSRVHVLGGAVLDAADATLVAFEQARMFLYGRDWAVDGAPVPLGPLKPESGELDGTLVDGFVFPDPSPDPDNFSQGGVGGSEGDGMIVLRGRSLPARLLGADAANRPTDIEFTGLEEVEYQLLHTTDLTESLGDWTQAVTGIEGTGALMVLGLPVATTLDPSGFFLVLPAVAALE